MWQILTIAILSPYMRVAFPDSDLILAAAKLSDSTSIATHQKPNLWELTYDELSKVDHIHLYRHVPKPVYHFNLQSPGRWWSQEPSFLSNPNKTRDKFYFLKLTLTAEELARAIPEHEGESWVPRDIEFNRKFNHPAQEITPREFQELKGTFPRGWMPNLVYLDRSEAPVFKVIGGEEYWIHWIAMCIQDKAKLPSHVIDDYQVRTKSINNDNSF
ncbi:MAG: hypothetical protein HYZ79_05810 [Candidatus Melainabacteria bacterium]|nr:hypothetical protein [Candidatus Melainabacteria bacterium]